MEWLHDFLIWIEKMNADGMVALELRCLTVYNFTICILSLVRIISVRNNLLFRFLLQEWTIFWKCLIYENEKNKDDELFRELRKTDAKIK